PGLVEKLRLLEMRESAPHGLLRLLRDRRQDRIRDVLADHRGRLEQVLLLRWQPVDPRRQDSLHRGRDLERLHRARQPVCPPLPARSGRTAGGTWSARTGRGTRYPPPSPARAPGSTRVRTRSSRKNGLPRFTSICVRGASPGSGPRRAPSSSVALSAARLSS